MITHIIALSLLCALVILIRAIFKNKISARIVYAFWLVVLIKLCIPVSFVSVDVPLPAFLDADPYFEESFAAEPDLSFDDTDLFTENTVTAPSLPEESIPPKPIEGEVSGITQNEMSSDLTQSAPTIPHSTVEKTDTQELSSPPISAGKLLLAVQLMGSLILTLFFATLSLVTQIKLKRKRTFHSREGRIPIYVSDGISSPCVTGIVPTVYITSYAKDCKDLDLIIKHELTHISHGDHIWALVRVFAVIVFWWNPLIWAAAILSKRDAELACDESVAKGMTTAERIGYSRLILDMIPVKRTFAVSFADAPIKHRLFRLTGKYKTGIVAAVIAVSLVAVSFGFAFVSYASDGKDESDAHVHTFEKATCTSPALCECGESDGDPLGHIWHEATCTKPKTCSRCKATEGSPISHTWTDPTCDSPKTCVVCKFFEGDHLEHIYTDATCTSPRLCTLCGGSEGEALGHTFVAATCTTPKTCTRCGATEGAALGHRYYYGICTVCNSRDPEFVAMINAILFPTPETAVSRYEAVVALGNAGYNSAEIERIFTAIGINWNEQALKYARNYVASKTAYSETGLRDFMKLRGYTQEQIDYAAGIVCKETPPVTEELQIADVPSLLYPFGYSDDWLTKCREYNEKYGKKDDDDDDDWKYGYGDPFVWDHGSYSP